MAAGGAERRALRVASGLPPLDRVPQRCVGRVRPGRRPAVCSPTRLGLLFFPGRSSGRPFRIWCRVGVPCGRRLEGRRSPTSPRGGVDPAGRSRSGTVGGGTKSQEESGVLRTRHHQGNRHHVGLLLCAALLAAPLLLIHQGAEASASPDHAHPSSVNQGSATAIGRATRPSHGAAARVTRPVVIADSAVRHDVPTTTAVSSGDVGTIASSPRSSLIVSPVVTPVVTTTAVSPPTPSTVPPPTPSPVPPPTTSPVPPPTTTTVPLPMGSDRGSGEVTYYAHPAGRCASPRLPFGTVVSITNPATGATVVCVVDDREADTSRAIDLATSTFAQLAPLSQGVVVARLRW